MIFNLTARGDWMKQFTITLDIKNERLFRDLFLLISTQDKDLWLVERVGYRDSPWILFTDKLWNGNKLPFLLSLFFQWLNYSQPFYILFVALNTLVEIENINVACNRADTYYYTLFAFHGRHFVPFFLFQVKTHAFIVYVLVYVPWFNKLTSKEKGAPHTCFDHFWIRISFTTNVYQGSLSECISFCIYLQYSTLSQFAIYLEDHWWVHLAGCPRILNALFGDHSDVFNFIASIVRNHSIGEPNE